SDWSSRPKSEPPKPEARKSGEVPGESEVALPIPTPVGRPTVEVATAGRTEEQALPLYMDVHTFPGEVATHDVATAHMADLQTQGKFDVRYLRYWIDGPGGKLFCLVEAPSAEAAQAVHRQAHGLLADEIYQVEEGC